MSYNDERGYVTPPTPSDEALTQALEWRSAIMPRLAVATEELAQAYASAPTSLERIQIARALTAARDAERTCLANVKLAQQRLG